MNVLYIYFAMSLLADGTTHSTAFDFKTLEACREHRENIVLVLNGADLVTEYVIGPCEKVILGKKA